MKTKRNKYSHLSDEERSVAYSMRGRGIGLRKICLALGRKETSAGSLSREFKRNKPKSPIVAKELDPFERARFAHEKALERRKIPRKQFKLGRDPELKKFVFDLLREEQASPRDICLRVKHELENKTLSHSSIYNYVKKHRRELTQYFRRKGKPSKQKLSRSRRRKSGAVKTKNISERSSLAKSRSEFGHYEIDTMHSRKGGSGYAILSIREMKSRRRWFFRIQDLKSETTLAVTKGFFRMLPAHIIRTLTCDNGPENKKLDQLESHFKIQIYSCDAYCAHQRGSVEQANGEFRYYKPKGTDFKDVSVSEVWEIQDKLNRRRMDCLKGRTAEEVFQEALENPPLIGLAGAEVLRSKETLFQAAFSHFEKSSVLFLPSQGLSG